MGEKKMPIYMTEDEVREEFNVKWDKRTFNRKIKSDGFPVMRDGYTKLYPRDRVRDYFKRREQ